jgi:hypothetical protein
MDGYMLLLPYTIMFWLKCFFNLSNILAFVNNLESKFINHKKRANVKPPKKEPAAAMNIG